MKSAIVSGLTLAFAGAALSAQAPQPLPERPALVVLVAIDQLRGDYLDRFASQLTGGLARFRNTSAFFPHAWQDHAMTETAPGHATMLSGREPVHTEIISNNRGVPDIASPLIGSNAMGASPRRFMGTTLYDWMVARDSTARVLSVSRKDRGAILPVGRAKGDVYWFADGRFTTSRYYRDTLPTWVQDFDESMHLERLAGKRWDLLLPASQYPEPDSVFVENDGRDFTFPHELPDASALKSKLASYPWMDSVTLAFALDGVHALRLGRRGAMKANEMPDLLSISLSTTDAVGHAFGPDSREIHDQVLRVDRWLGTFFDSLQRELGTDRIAIVLTADHGIAPLPELTAMKTGKGGRISLGDIAVAMERALESRYHTDFGIEFDTGLFYADVVSLRAHGINVDSLSNVIMAAAKDRRGVRIGFTKRTLASSSDSGAVRWRRTLPPAQGWLAAFVAENDYVWSAGKASAEHGTPNALSRAVPIAFTGPGFAIGRHERLARTVDIAPTLAAYLGIAPLEPLDGHALGEVLRERKKADNSKQR